jgi:hypothetical protein
MLYLGILWFLCYLVHRILFPRCRFSARKQNIGEVILQYFCLVCDCRWSQDIGSRYFYLAARTLTMSSLCYQTLLIQKQSTLFLTHLGLIFLLCISNQQKKPFNKPSNVYSYLILFQLAHWFQRGRLKTDNTHFDTFGPHVSVVYFQSKKPSIL